MKEQKLDTNFNGKNKHRFAMFGTLAFIALVALSGISFKSNEKAIADNPTFYFSASSSCSDSAPSLTKPTGNSPALPPLYLCVDGDNEGTGLLGAELNITYSTEYIQVTGISCSTFDTCIDLSEEETMKILAASGPADEGGTPVKTQQKLANINVNLLKEGVTKLVFTVSQIIDENEEVKVRNATSLNLTISGEAEEEPEEETKESEEEIPADCNNGKIDAGEDCDPAAASSSWKYTSCLDSGFDGGPLSCSDTCKLDYTACEGAPPGVCGNGIVEPGEDCDDANFRDGDGCSAVCIAEEGFEPAVEPPVVPPEEPRVGGSDLTNVSVNVQYPATSIAKGSSIQIFAFAYFADGSSQSVTSCFPCPTNGSDIRNGSVTYHVRGPGRFAGNYLYANSDANVGDTITFSATYNDNKSGISKTSASENLTVTAERPTEEEVVKPVVEPAVEPVTEPTEGATPTEPEGEGSMRGAAPLTPSEAISQAASTLSEQTSQGSVEFEVTAKPADDICVQNYSNETDTDGDGLTDRTECYIKTDPAKSDSDGDSCWDGDEINQFYTSPLNASDCSIETKTEDSVIITDPQPGWIVKKVEVSGITPKNSTSVAAVVFSAEYKSLKAAIDALKTVMADRDDASISTLETAISDLQTFTDTYSAYEYDELANAMDSLKTKVESVKGINKWLINRMNFQASVDYLNSKLTEPIYLGNTADLPEAALGENTAKKFHIVTDQTLQDNKLYDVVAIASLSGGETKTSNPVRFSVDSTLDSAKPIPRSIGGEVIPYGSVALKGILIDGVLAANDNGTAEVQIKDQKPVISGDTEYGSQVFAIWESIVLTSSVISDSEQGAFAIQAPRNLEDNTAHTVTLYALKTDETGQKMRSEDVNVFFRVKTQVLPWGLVFGGFGTALALILLLFVIKRRMKNKAMAKAEAQAKIEEAEKVYTAVSAPVQAVAKQAPYVPEKAERYEEIVKKPIFQALEQAPVKPVQPAQVSYVPNKEEFLKETLMHTDEETIHEAEKELEYSMHKLDAAMHKFDEDRHI